MAKAADRVLDVWIVETQAVYTAVPFTVVADWLQEGRLLAADRVRLAGKSTWHAISKVPALSPYLPREDVLETEAASESLEPVELGWNWKRPEETEDDDVDMIPLIDISLVLLIFFMMTATVASGVLSPIQTPETRYPTGVLAADQYWIGVDSKNPAGLEAKDDSGRPLPWFSLGRDLDEMSPPTTDFVETRGRLANELKSASGEVKVRIRADRGLPVDVITDLMRRVRELQAEVNRDRPNDQRVNLILLGEVSEAR